MALRVLDATLGRDLGESLERLLRQPSEAEAERFGWRWVLAAVGADESVVILDPSKAIRGKQVRVAADAQVANLLQWMDRR